MRSSDKSTTENLYKIFKPQLTPKEMMELGVFGGSYFGNKTTEYPKSLFKNSKQSKTFDVKKIILELKLD